MILLDTNILIQFIKGSPVVVDWVQRIPRGELGIPAVVVYEIEYGTLKASFSAKRRQLLHSAIAHAVQVPFDTPAALAAARVRVQLERAKCVIAPMNLLIAGTTLSRHATLATMNAKEFSRIAGLTLVSPS